MSQRLYEALKTSLRKMERDDLERYAAGGAAMINESLTQNPEISLTTDMFRIGMSEDQTDEFADLTADVRVDVDRILTGIN